MGLLVYAVLLDESGAMACPELEFWRIIQYEATRIHEVKQGDQCVTKYYKHLERRESRRSVMMGGSSSTIVTGNSTLASATTEAANFAG
ncbi:hypothetical protein CK203_051028 [Vitis vinifera]|uniref:Uncharacterized protein n=1 Tax=Vitis vinifera TaxID=29760 RepID=A0A438GPY0_VITVI|nr:hypothetical protein CK203_051028 [Vitis vinifera]